MHEGQVIGGYVLERNLGRGGMGQVWLARHQDVDFEVAIKGLKDRLDRDKRRRFIDEMKALANCRHENIVAFHGPVTDGEDLYLSMQYVPGPNLRDRAEQVPPMTPDEKVQILVQVLDALTYLHDEVKVVHRDLKPSNILLNNAGKVFLADFGIAKFQDLDLTQTDLGVAGTAKYSAPELFSGGRATYSSDVWSFGAIAMELFAAKHPRLDGVAEGRFAGPLTDLIRACVNDVTSSRPSAQELLHAFQEVSRVGFAAASREEARAASDETEPVMPSQFPWAAKPRPAQSPRSSNAGKASSVSTPGAAGGSKTGKVPPGGTKSTRKRKAPDETMQALILMGVAALALTAVGLANKGIIPVREWLAEDATVAPTLAAESPEPSVPAEVSASPSSPPSPPSPEATSVPPTISTIAVDAGMLGVRTDNGERVVAVAWDAYSSDRERITGEDCEIRIIVSGPQQSEQLHDDCSSDNPAAFFLSAGGAYEVRVTDTLTGSFGTSALTVNP